MKKIYFIALAVFVTGYTQAQTEQDSTVTIKKNSKTSIKIGDGEVKITVGNADSTTKKIVKPVKYPKLSFGLTFEHFDIGLSKYHTGSDFSTPAGYDYLDTKPWKTINVGFDLVQMGVRFTPNVKVMLAAGLDWNHMRLTQNVTIQPENLVLDIVNKPDDGINYDKNRFSSRYIRVPLYFEYRTPKNDKGKRASIVFGPEVGFLLNGKVKQVSDENGKQKFSDDDYNFEPFRYGANVRIGYGGAGLFFKYYMNDVFANNQGPADYKNLNFGLTFGF
ncbi:outer membrane beta-barrel protein [Pedobacter alpinus]|uniref:Outer membrane beta-barrel protein n=1 Tax=Pedobacter alpinus TaxID=1590643 RepID=A0ABW5TSQ3_9SPHI